MLEEHACQCQEQVRCNALEYFNCCKDHIVTVTTKLQDSHLLEMCLTEVDSFPLFSQLVLNQETVILELVVTSTISSVSLKK